MNIFGQKKVRQFPHLPNRCHTFRVINSVDYCVHYYDFITVKCANCVRRPRTSRYIRSPYSLETGISYSLFRLYAQGNQCGLDPFYTSLSWFGDTSARSGMAVCAKSLIWCLDMASLPLLPWPYCCVRREGEIVSNTDRFFLFKTDCHLSKLFSRPTILCWWNIDYSALPLLECQLYLSLYFSCASIPVN